MVIKPTSTEIKQEMEGIVRQIREITQEANCENKEVTKEVTKVEINRGKYRTEFPSSESENNDICSGFRENTNVGEGNINCLKPAALLFIFIVMQGVRVKALVDSGAAVSFVSHSVFDKIEAEINRNDRQMVIGYGEGKKMTEGSCNTEFNYAGLKFKGKLHVINDQAITYDAVLGIDFLKQNRVTIDIYKRTLSFKANDDSIVHVTIDNETNEVCSVRHENVPIFATNTVTVDKQQTKWVTTNCEGKFKSDDDIYFEGNSTDKYECLCGIMKVENKQICVKNNDDKRKLTIRKGEKVGTISNLVTVNFQQTVKKTFTKQKIMEDIKLDNDKLTEGMKDRVYDLLMASNSVLSVGDTDIGRVVGTPHRIVLTNHTPIWQKPRQFAEPIQNEIEKQCNELLAADIIENSESDWSSPCVPVRKGDGSLRLCLDYRKVNHVTKAEQFPMPNVTQCLFRAHKMQYFSKIDLVKGYYQVEIDEQSKQYTAFSTLNNHYQFKRLPFGLKNSGIAFQRTMQQILSPLGSKNIIIYIDDILIMAETFEEHLLLLGKVMNTLAKHNIKIKVSKCEFFKSSIKFLGHVLSTNGIKKAPEYVEKVRSFQKPSTITELRKFLGLINFQRKFIPYCSAISKPLTELTGQPKRSKIKWTDERTKAFDDLRAAVEKEVTLSFPDYSEEAAPLELYVDASDVGAGACLVQDQGDEYRTIGYASMAFSSTQSRYSTIERELTAIRWGVRTFRPFLLGVTFQLFTDHKPLIYMHNLAPHSSRIQRTLEELGEYDFQIKYKPGAENCAADYLSRLEAKERECETVQYELPKHLKILKKVDGGGDSMVEALYLAVEDCFEDKAIEFVDSYKGLRKVLVNELLTDMKLYKLENTKTMKKTLKAMLNDGQRLCSEIFLAASRVFNVQIRVYHDISIPVVYEFDQKEKKPVINLQCKAYVHYNPLFSKKVEDEITSKRNVNTCSGQDVLADDSSEDDNDNGDLVQCLFGEKDTSENLILMCKHEKLASGIELEYNGMKLCGLIDTGAQVSVIDELCWEKIKEGMEEIEVVNLRKLKGLGGAKTDVIGSVELEIQIGLATMVKHSFVIVKGSGLPCCILLGLNFLLENQLLLNFDKGIITGGVNDTVTAEINLSQLINREIFVYSCSSFEDKSGISEEGEIERNKVNCRWKISMEEIINMQKHDHAINLLREKVKVSSYSREWNEPSLKQFKRHENALKINDGVLFRHRDGITTIVVSFCFLVELVWKIHCQLAHIGRHKLLSMISKKFWHPALDKVARELCASCRYCQLSKTNLQQRTPPMIRVDSKFPFNMVAVDLIQFPKSSSGNVVALVAVDHYSKWLSAVALRDKTARSVARGMKNIISALPRVPVKILSDNGPEFRAEETEIMLKELGIDHVYSSPYHPAGNGAVERANRTLKELLMGLIVRPGDWDVVLSKAIVTYNHTYHSQIQTTPSDFIMSKEHTKVDELIIDGNTKENWKIGHPNFSPFEVGQQVIKKKNRKGHLVANKFSAKYEGPFRVVKVQDNGVSYEIKMDNENTILKSHHSKLRNWRELPESIKRFLPDWDTKEEVNSDNSSDDCKGAGLVNFVSSDESQTESFSAQHSVTGNRIMKRKKKERTDKVRFCSKERTNVNEVDRDIKGRNENLLSFRCSESIIYDRDQNVNSTPCSDRLIEFKDYIDESKFLKLQQTFDVHEKILDMSLDILNAMERETSDAKNSLNNNIVKTMVSGDVSKENETEDIIETGDREKKRIENNQSENLERSNERQEKSASLINEMKEIIACGRRNLLMGRDRSMDMRKEIWGYRQAKSILGSTANSTNINSLLQEMDDQLSPLPKTPVGRVLRSQGSVPEYPRVQHRILEYKRRTIVD